MFRVLGLAAALACLCLSSALAATKPSYGPPPAWVEVAPLPALPPPAAAAAVQVLLDDNQSRLGPDGDAYYNRRVRRILKPEGLPGVTSFGMTWSPDTETVTFHTVRIIRDGKSIDLLQGGKHMLVLRRETDLERAMIDGRMTASQQIEGLQVGDILDTSWTQTRRDPITAGRSYDSEALTFAGVAARYRARISWPEGDAVHWKATAGFGDPVVSRHDGRSWLDLDLTDASTPQPPVGAPLRFRRLGTMETSGFEHWSEISRLMWPHYAKAMALSADSPLKKEAEAIAAGVADPKARAFAALQLVEDKTRYFFIGLGDGGYVPARAEQTWTRKFGDCKGKTVLLLALLKELGIDAEPVLVNLGEGDGLNERVPSLAAFNHVLVRAKIDGRTYWLDGTRTGDRSGLAALKAPPHRWGLPLTVTGSDLDPIAQTPLTEPILDATMRLDATKGLDKPADVRMVMRATGDFANLLRQTAARATAADMERSLRQQLSGSMTWIQPDKISWKDDPEHDAFSFELTGVADMDWRKNPDLGMLEYRVVASQTQPGGYPRREPGPNRDAPFAVGYPLFVRGVSEIVLPGSGKGFSIRGPNDVEAVGGYELKRTSVLKDGVARFVVEARSTAPEISAAEAEAATKAFRRLAGEDSLVRAPL